MAPRNGGPRIGLEALRGIKQALDPQGIMNPNKIIVPPAE